MGNLDNLDLSGYDAKISYPPLPAGEYEVQVVYAGVTTTKNGDPRVSVQYEVLSGEYAKRKFFDNFNVFSRNAMAQEVSRRNLKTMLTACHHPHPDEPGDTETFLDRKLKVKVGIEVFQDQNRNIVKGYMELGGAAPQPAPVRQQAPSPQQMQAKPSEAQKMPWEI